jgi:hypothetical protein
MQLKVGDILVDYDGDEVQVKEVIVVKSGITKDARLYIISDYNNFDEYQFAVLTVEELVDDYDFRIKID